MATGLSRESLIDRRAACRVAALLALFWMPVGFGPSAGESAATTPGASVYREGRLPDGRPLRGTREAGGYVEGEDAACANCHRRSGYGSIEGTIVIPPIIGPYLFRPPGDLVRDLSVPHFPGYRASRPPYDSATLARAIREGIGPDGRVLNPLMPRFDLDAASMAALEDHLRGLSAGPPPGVQDDALHFATIVTPDADPAAADAMVDIIERYFADHNQVVGASARPAAADKSDAYRVSRAWRLHVWRLTGPAERWESQLAGDLAREPAFAVVAGLGKASWAPVHRFCERMAIPCLMPIVDLPVDSERDFYTVYFSRGVLLEADLIAGDLATSGRRHVIQIARADDIGAPAAAAVSRALAASGIEVEIRAMPLEGTSSSLGIAGRVGPDDAVVLWLRPADLSRLPPAPPPGVRVYVSGLMAGREAAALPPDWRGEVRMAYPLELPERRAIHMNFPFGWMRGRRIAPRFEWVQVHTYLACQILSDTLTEMLDGYARDYLLERLESMVGHRLSNAYYPRLSLGPHQRFASKGGYLVRFGGPDHARPQADGGWRVP
jgi:hypothetical protein